MLGVVVGLNAPREDVFHAVLGRLSWDAEVDAWVAIVSGQGGPIRFELGGDDAPHPALVEQASDIATQLSAFEGALQSFMESHWIEFRGSPADLVEYKAELTAASTGCGMPT